MHSNKKETSKEKNILHVLKNNSKPIMFLKKTIEISLKCGEKKIVELVRFKGFV